MSCLSPDRKPDWKAYALGELGSADQRQAETHAESCTACREELAMLRLTLDSLSTLREEEVPRRIAFVSDPVFEPKWWQRLLRTPAFAAASVLAVAIVAHGAMAPRGLSEEEVQARVQAQVQAEVRAVLAGVEENMEVALGRQQYMVQTMYKQTQGLVTE